jgi:signal peptidase I
MPQRLDIVLYAEIRDSDVTDPPELVTRVIGLPGDTIEARDGNVHVNDSMLDEPYLKNPQIPALPFGPITLGTDELWLMGDNRQSSGECEFHGPISISWLRARVTQIAHT